MKQVTILIPTFNRPEALAVTLTSLCFQSFKDFDVIISDQSEESCLHQHAPFGTALRLLEIRGHEITLLRNFPPRGMAQQRQFLLEQSESPLSLFLDDDLILDSFVIENLTKVMLEERCGFVGSGAIGLSYKNDDRPEEQHIDFWEGNIMPEKIAPGSREWERYKLHNAANLLHLQQKLKVSPENPRKYKVAWIGGCVLYDTQKLKDSGGFSFWKSLPEKHCGEDVLAQLKIMKNHGGCGILPTGVYHQELKTTVVEREINAPEYLEI